MDPTSRGIPHRDIRMGYLAILERSEFLLTDGATGTCLEQETGVRLDPVIGPTALVDDNRGSAALEALYRRYLDVGRRHGLPMQVGTPTFRACPERLRRAGYYGPNDVRRVNGNCFRLLAHLREGLGDYGEKVYIAGVIGPKGDCYKPEEAPGTDVAADHHRAQAEALAETGVDLLVAATLPAAPEALGVARAMAGTGLPYVISAVIRGSGSLLDGTPLAEVIERIDGSASPRPAYYAVNCVHPSVLREALRSNERLRRLAGVRAARLQGERLSPAAGGVGGPGPPRSRVPGAARRRDRGPAGCVRPECPRRLLRHRRPPHRRPRRSPDGRETLNRLPG